MNWLVGAHNYLPLGVELNFEMLILKNWFFAIVTPLHLGITNLPFFTCHGM